jgi:hypothetical protein
MNEKDLLAVARKHALPVDHNEWAYTEQVLAFGRDLAGEEWPEEHAFPPLPMSVVSHKAMGSMYARFDLQLYAVQFEKRSRAAISAALGLEGADAGDPNAILAAIEALKAKPVECAARKQGTAGGNAPADCDWPGCGCDPVANKVLDALTDHNGVALTVAQQDVLRERQWGHYVREGFTDKKDDQYDAGTLAAAGAAYAQAAADLLSPHAPNESKAQFHTTPPDYWPWPLKWWKPKNARTALVKSASLLLAEIERMDRDVQKGEPE